MVARVDSAAHLEVLGDARSALRLVRDVARKGALSADTISRTLSILRGFVVVARCSGADRTVAVATAAVREASNGEAFVEQARAELGVEVNIADAEQEAEFGFLGAIHALPIEHGIVLDVGGGSLQLIHFRNRRQLRSWSLKLGALRLSDRYLASDPPTRGEMRSLKDYVDSALRLAGVTSLRFDEQLVGTGGTVRNLAKVDRRLIGEYPISRLHGYVVERRRLDEVTSLLATASAGDRSGVPGLNEDRLDSIVGGALVVQAVMDRLLANQLTVAGYGLREGVALRSVTDEAAALDDVQRVAVASLGGQFLNWDRTRADRRAGLVARLLAALRPMFPLEVTTAAGCAARLLELGSSIDYYRRFAHSSRIIADANLDGYSHHTLALTAAAVLAVGEREASIKGFAPLLGPADCQVIEQVAAVVGLADCLVRYGSADVDSATPQRNNGHVALATPVVDSWPLEAPINRAERAFGVSFTIGAAAGVG
jgi:exopolyphosphatase/guanosine-5'-triphosphate,3'-diphosphate pyrophosphatase